MLQIVAQLIVQFFPVGKLRNKIITVYTIYQTSTCVLIRQFQTFFSSKWLIRLMPNFVNVIINLKTNNDKSNYDKVSLLYM